MKQLIGGLLVVLSIFSCESDETKGARFFIKGNEALNKGEYKEAIRFYTEAIDKFPALEDAYNNRGVAYYKSGEYFNAIQDYSKLILEMNDEHFNARGNRVDAYIASGRNEDAIRDLKWAKEYFPDSAMVDFKMGLANFGLKNYQASATNFNEAYTKDPKDVEAVVNAANAYYFMGEFQEAEIKLQAAEALDPTEANIYNTRCMMSIEKRDYDGAVSHIEQALSFDSNNGIYLNNRGFLKLMNGEIEAGGKDIDRAIVSDPQNAWAYRNKGIYYFMKERYDDALRNFVQTARIEEDMNFLHYYWGATLLKLDKQGEACQKLEQSLERNEPEGKGLFAQNCRRS